MTCTKEAKQASEYASQIAGLHVQLVVAKHKGDYTPEYQQEIKKTLLEDFNKGEMSLDELFSMRQEYLEMNK